jgi:hypothetical protein
MDIKRINIGNAVWSEELDLNTGKYNKIVVIVDRHIHYYILTGNYLNKYTDIPLTASILMFNLGFEPSHKVGFRRFYDIGNLVVEACEGNDFPVYYPKGELLCFAHSVSHLQNLYMFLSDSELPFKDLTHQIEINIIPINYADFDLVEIKNGTPHCKKHGAMNKMNTLEDGGGYWRCLSAITTHNDTACRAGCCEIKKNKN